MTQWYKDSLFLNDFAMGFVFSSLYAVLESLRHIHRKIKLHFQFDESQIHEFSNSVSFFLSVEWRPMGIPYILEFCVTWGSNVPSKYNFPHFTFFFFLLWQLILWIGCHCFNCLLYSFWLEFLKWEWQKYSRINMPLRW